MQCNDTTRRRIFGAICLFAAALMLALGNTKPRSGEPYWLFVVYWATCFILAALAMITAIRDAAIVRREAQNQQRELLENALQSIESEKRRRAETGNAPGRSADLRG